MIQSWGDPFGKRTEWPLIYFLIYVYLNILVQSQILVISLYKDPEITCLLIAQGYGLTETTGGISLSTKKDLSVATVGQTLPGVKIKLKDWAEGDYLVQGKNDIGPCGEILIGGPMVASGKDLFRIGQNNSHQILFLKLQLRGAYVPLT